MEDWAFIILFVFGMTFIVFLANSIGISFIESNFNSTAMNMPDCNITQPLETISCASSSMTFFFSLTQLSSSFVILQMIFAGLGAGLIFMIIKLVRGTG